MISLDIINAFTYKYIILFFFLKSPPQANFFESPSLGPSYTFNPSPLHSYTFQTLSQI